MPKLGSKLILLAMFVFSVSPLVADIPIGAIYDCGQYGSAGYESCLNAMALGEAQFLASYTPTGSPLPNNWASLLPPPPLGYSYLLNIGGAHISPDGLSQVVFETNGIEDIWPVAIWHEGSLEFVDGLYAHINFCIGCFTHLEINDQGNLAAIGGDLGCAFLGAVCSDRLILGVDPGWSSHLGRVALNDDNQVLFDGLNTATGSLDYVLIDPPGAPIPGVPEPASRALLATVVALMTPLVRKIQVDGRAQDGRSIPRALDV